MTLTWKENLSRTAPPMETPSCCRQPLSRRIHLGTAVTFFISLFSLIAVVAFAETPKDLSERLPGVASVAVLRTDTYWDGGSVGITLKTNKGEVFELRTLNQKLSPDQRTLVFSETPREKGVPILKDSDLEKQLIRLLRTQPKQDARGHEIAGHLLRILKDRNTAWTNGWYTLEYLTGSLSPFAGGAYEGSFQGETTVGKSGGDKVVCSVTVKRATSGYAVAGSLGFASGSGPAPDFEGVGYPGKDGSLYFTFTDSFGNKGPGRFFVKDGKTILSLSLDWTPDTRPAALYRSFELKKNANIRRGGVPAGK